MTVFRNNKESLLAVLEALVYDPLINWRLVQGESQGKYWSVIICLVAKYGSRLFLGPPEVASSLGSTDGGPNRRTVLNETEILDGMAIHGDRCLTDVVRVDATAAGFNLEVRNERALAVYNRVETKLTGR